MSYNALVSLTPADVVSVYSGKAYRCCCGCSGKHTYNPQHRAYASKSRGYAVTDDEVSNVTVTRILNRLQRNAEFVECEGSFYTLTEGQRWYIVYTK